MIWPSRVSLSSGSADVAAALARADFGCDSLTAAAFRVRCFLAFAGAVGHEVETSDAAYILAFHVNGAVFFNSRHQLFLLCQPAHQYAGPTVNETLGEPFMQRIRKLFFYFLCAALPIEGRL